MNKKMVFWLQWFFIPFFLLIFWIVASILFNPYESYTTFIYDHDFHNYSRMPKDNLLIQGQKLEGEFIAQEDNLGIVQVQVSDTLSVQPDNVHRIEFSIKQRDSSDWYYQHVYQLDSVKEGNFLIFGFPKIEHSIGRKYQFEIISLNGDKTSAIYIIKGDKSFISRYTYTLKEVLHKRLYFVIAQKKIFQLFQNLDVFLSSLIFLLPGILYISCLVLFYFSKKSSYTKQFSTKNFLIHGLFIYLPILSILIDIFTLQQIFYGVTLGILCFWIVVVIKSNLSYKYSLLFSGLLLLLAEWFSIFSKIPSENKSAMWSYLFFLVVIIQVVFSSIRKKERDFRD